MLSILKKDTFVKDLLIMLLVSTVLAALFAGGFAMVSDKYFAKAVTGVMGDFGQYDLLFQTREELKGAMARQIQQVIDERFPGATLKSGIAGLGKATFFLTLPSQYKTKEIFNSLGYFFNNLPGNGGFSVMTEPRINITSVPTGIFDLLSKEVDQLPEVQFTFKDGASIGVILKKAHDSEAALVKIKKLLAKYQILEVRLGRDYSQEELLTMGKNISQSLVGIKGVDYAKDITMSGSGDEFQYLANTMTQIKEFMLAYAAEVRIKPGPGQEVAVGDLLALNGKNAKDLRPGKLLEPLEVVVKVTAIDAAGVHGLIIQGDSSYLRDQTAYKVLPGDKIGQPVGIIEVSSRKGQLMYGIDQGVKLLTQLNLAISDYNTATGGPGLTVSGVEKAYRQLVDIQGALKGIESGVDGLTGKADQSSLTRMVRLIDGVADDLDYLAKNFARVQILESRFNKAVSGLESAQLLMGSPLLQNSLGQAGGIGDKVELLNSQLTMVTDSLRERVRMLDDFINRLNPLVGVLISWKNKANSLAREVNSFGAVFTPGSENNQNLKELISSTNQAIAGITGVNLDGVKTGLNVATDRLFGSEKIDLSAMIAELERFRDSLPKLLDEEIGNTVGLIDKYVGGASVAGQRIQIFTKTGIDRELVDAAIQDSIGGAQMGIFSLPVGTINPDIRSELYKILGEVRSTIAALVVLILWVLTFILDQSLIISMLKMMGFSLFPAKLRFDNRWLDRGYQIIQRFINPANLYAGAIGGIWLAAAFMLSGARIPYLNIWEIGLFGMVLGILISSLAERINPVGKDEVMAGLSLGLPFKTIMREIVIPAGRPGMLQILNRWKMIMK